jgi:hypothetical protein
MKSILGMCLVALVGYGIGCSGASETTPSDSGSAIDSAGVDNLPVDAAPINTDQANPEPDVKADTTPIQEPESSAYFIQHIQPQLIPGRFPASECTALTEHHTCVTTEGCHWLRTIKDDGMCRRDPVARCLESGECACEAHDFHGPGDYADDLEVFVPLSISWQNMAPRTSAYQGGENRYATTLDMEPVVNESMENFTSRTDFSHKTLTVTSQSPTDMAELVEATGLSLTMKFMQVWDKEPLAMTGSLFKGLGFEVVLKSGQLFLLKGDTEMPLSGEHPSTGGAKDYQCNQLAIVIPADGDATVYLGKVTTTMAGLDMAFVKSQIQGSANPLEALRVGAINAKVWDLRVYTRGRQLSAEEIADIGKRCADAGDYAIPDGYPESNKRYSYGMGGTKVSPNHATQAFSSGVYVTMRIPEPDTFPPTDPTYRDNLNRMIGFWDRWHEQMFFELDMVPFVDNRKLEPEGSLNTYRRYPDSFCPEGADGCGEPRNYNNPCRYVTDLFQAFNWLPEDFPEEPTSADHRKIAENGGWTRWDAYAPDVYGGWQRPVHEHGHTAHFTLMRTYQRVHHYIRGIAGESFAEIMSHYVFAGVKSWMSQGLLYYPTIPLAFEGRWDHTLEKHVFKSSQPYQEKNIDDQGLGARFYGLGVWWTYVSHYAGKPYLIGRLSADSDVTPGTTLQKMRYYLAQEGLDMGELFANFAAHVATWDWPHTGHHFYAAEQDPFQGVEKWCTQNTGPDCTLDELKIQADVSPDLGTEGEWVDSPEGRDPGGFATSTVRIAEAPGGSLFEVSLDFEVPEWLYPDTHYAIGLPSFCRNDPRFFSSRIVVAEAGTEGQEKRPNRPQYYKIPGRHVDKVIIRVPEGPPSNVYLLAIPTPPFELEDVPGFVDGTSLRWPFRYKVTRMESLPPDAQPASPIVLGADEMLELTPQPGAGFTHDCFTP